MIVTQDQVTVNLSAAPSLVTEHEVSYEEEITVFLKDSGDVSDILSSGTLPEMRVDHLEEPGSVVSVETRELDDIDVTVIG